MFRNPVLFSGWHGEPRSHDVPAAHGVYPNGPAGWPAICWLHLVGAIKRRQRPCFTYKAAFCSVDKDYNSSIDRRIKQHAYIVLPPTKLSLSYKL